MIIDEIKFHEGTYVLKIYLYLYIISIFVYNLTIDNILDKLIPIDIYILRPHAGKPDSMVYSNLDTRSTKVRNF